MARTLEEKVRTGLGWSAVNTLVGRVGQLVLGVVLARLIAPEDFGVYAAALVVVTVLTGISDLSVGMALVRAPDRAEVDRIGPTVTTLSIASGCLLAGAMMLMAPVLASALNAPAATDPLRVLSLILVLAGLSTVPSALLAREFLQRRKLVADLTALAVSSSVAAGLAIAGYGVWALVWSRLAHHLVSATLLFILAPGRYRPGFDRAEAIALLRFGLPLAGTSLVTIGLLDVDYAVIGPVLGPLALGLYVLAFNISGWPVTAFAMTIRAVSLPGFSQLRADPDRHRRSFGQALGILLVPTVPLCVLLALLSGPLVRVVYGERWSAAAAPLAYLAALGGGRVVTQLAYDFLVSCGATTTAFRLNLTWFAALVPALVVGAHAGGIAGVGLGHVIVLAAVVLPTHALALRGQGVELPSILGPAARPLAGGAAMAVLGVVVMAPLQGDLERLAIVTPVTLAAYAALVVAPLWRRHRQGRLLTVFSATITPPAVERGLTPV